MPLINGLKMACEPCIRGHRSTKCTHANERLMVPVKKPGRPLSACPHLHNQLCGCSSVTAAIPRKQKCHCGTGTAVGPVLAVQPRPVLSNIPDIPSPTRVTFRVQKPPLLTRPRSRKQSYDLNNLERMDASNLNITPYSTPISLPGRGQASTNGNSTSNGHSPSDDRSTTATRLSHANGSYRPQSSGGTPNPLLQSQHPNFPFPSDNLKEEYLAGYSASGNAMFDSNDLCLSTKTQEQHASADTEISVGAPCCSEKANPGNGLAAFGLQPFEITDSASRSGSSALSLVSSGGTPDTPVANGHLDATQYFFQDEFTNVQDLYSSFTPQPTIYEYPASYGSYQHPLQPSQWRKDFRSNMYAQPILQPDVMNDLTTFPVELFSDPKTRHSCSCGDTCQCIGCAAHPYNDATRNCVRSAYVLSHEPPSIPTPEDFINGHATNGSPPFPINPSHHPDYGNGHGRNHMHDTNSNNTAEDLPHAESPSEEDSSLLLEEEQTLPASDYFFVNYPFAAESDDCCGGDTMSCPCGDECECIGCTIHRFDESALAPLETPLAGDEPWPPARETQQHQQEETITNGGGDDRGSLLVLNSISGSGGIAVKEEREELHPLNDTLVREPMRSGCCS